MDCDSTSWNDTGIVLIKNGIIFWLETDFHHSQRLRKIWRSCSASPKCIAINSHSRRQTLAVQIEKIWNADKLEDERHFVCCTKSMLQHATHTHTANERECNFGCWIENLYTISYIGVNRSTVPSFTCTLSRNSWPCRAKRINEIAIHSAETHVQLYKRTLHSFRCRHRCRRRLWPIHRLMVSHRRRFFHKRQSCVFPFAK